MLEKIFLSGNDWSVSYRDKDFTEIGVAVTYVPCNVEHILIKEGLLPENLYYGENVLKTQEFEGFNYVFTKRFDVDDVNAKYRLVFEGVDTIAEYFLNGVKIGESDNMLVEHVFEVSNLKQENNELVVKIYSTTNFNNTQTGNAYLSASWNNLEYANLRRAGHTYGWDIMPRLISAGIWKDVYLEKLKPTYISDFYLTTRAINGNNAFLQASYEITSLNAITNNGKYSIEIIGALENDVFTVKKDVYFKSNVIKFDVENAKLWWPKGAGKQNLYLVTVNLYENDVIIDKYVINFGIRTVNLSLIDEFGNDDFTFIVNGEKLYMRGANHVPLSPLHSEDLARTEKAFEIINDYQMNMVRLWGGNVYESNLFYDLADKNGVLIWQDFTFGCATYPQNETFFNKVKLEVEKVVKRIRNHPCIAIYAGDNEVDAMLSEFNVNPEINKLNREIIANEISLHDPYRDYLPSSPYVNEKVFKKYRTTALYNTPEQHLWGGRDWYKSPFYKDNTAKFVSEIGIHGSVIEDSLTKFIPKNKLNDRYDESWILHSTDQHHNPARIKLMEKHIKLTFNYVPTNYKEFCKLSSYPHTEGFKFYLENSRFNRPYTTGMLLWNYLDGWPQFSEAFVDFYFNKKRGYEIIKRSFAPILVGVKENINSRYEVVVDNQTLTDENVKYTVYDGETNNVFISGEVLAKNNSLTFIKELENIFFDKKLLIIKYEINGNTYYNHFITGFPTYEVSKFDKWYAILDSLK